MCSLCVYWDTLGLGVCCALSALFFSPLHARTRARCSPVDAHRQLDVCVERICFNDLVTRWKKRNTRRPVPSSAMSEAAGRMSTYYWLASCRRDEQTAPVCFVSIPVAAYSCCVSCRNNNNYETFLADAQRKTNVFLLRLYLQDTNRFPGISKLENYYYSATWKRNKCVKSLRARLNSIHLIQFVYCSNLSKVSHTPVCVHTSIQRFAAQF